VPLFSLPASAAFRQSRPVILTAFTNKIGSVGLSLIAILLVNRGVSTGEGTAVLSALKVTMLAGTVIGGALSDRFSSRSLALAALLMSAAGLGFMPFQTSIWMILIFGMLAQFAESQLNIVQRLLLMGQVDPANQKEALGWLRMVHNAAQIVSFSVAAIGARFGLTPLMLFDAATSLSAFFIGRRILPRREGSHDDKHRLGASSAAGLPSASAFFRCAFVLMGWAFFYELFLEGGAGRLEILHPDEGLRRFSTMMVLNTILCAGFSVQASKLFKNAWMAISGGMLLMALGTLVAVWGMASQLWVLGGMTCISMGELMFGAVAQYTLMRLTPANRNAGFYYSLGIMLMQTGRVLGGTLAFPILIHAPSLAPFFAITLGTLGLQLAVLWSLRGEVERLA
jgi:hypothetical protein